MTGSGPRANSFRVGDRVILLSFNGATEAPRDIGEQNNYWRLIGGSGVVVDADPPDFIEGQRVLVRFAINVESLGLHCHNEVENALWIRQDDLEKCTN